MTTDEFRRLGHALVEWVASYRESVENFPVMSRVAPGDVRLEPGDILRGCLLELPGLTPIAVSIEARHADRPAKTPVAGLRTCGCRFVDLPGPAETQIQRYVSAVERERLRLRA